MARESAWFERDTKQVASTGNELQRNRAGWRKVVVTANELTGNIVIEYMMPNGEPNSKHYTRAQIAANAADIIWAIAQHVTP